MWPAVIVAVEVRVENGLHLVDGLEPDAAALDAEVLVEQRAMQPLDNAVGLRPLDPGGAVLDRLIPRLIRYVTLCDNALLKKGYIKEIKNLIPYPSNKTVRRLAVHIPINHPHCLNFSFLVGVLIAHFTPENVIAVPCVPQDNGKHDNNTNQHKR